MTTIYTVTITKIETNAPPLLQQLVVFQSVVGSRNSALDPEELVTLVSKIATGELEIELDTIPTTNEVHPE